MSIYLKLNSNIRIGDLSGVSNRIVEFLEGEDLTPYPEYDQIMPDLKALTDALTLAMKRGDIESELADLDAVRDKALSNLSTILKGYSSIPAAEISEPAQRLLNIFNRYGLEIANYRYDAESGHIKSLLQDFAAPEAVADSAALSHLDTAISILSNAQQNFETKKIAYDRAIENRQGNTQSASNIKPQLLNVINDNLVNYHIAMVKFKDANFKELADTVNNWIVDANRNAQNGQQDPDVDDPDVDTPDTDEPETRG